MSNSLRPRYKTYPFVDLPRTSEEHYYFTRNARLHLKKEVLASRESFIAAIEADEEFAEFWSKFCKENPDFADSWLSDFDTTKPCDNSRIIESYMRFHLLREFDEISPVERRKIQNEFDAIRLTLYQSFLHEEAVRLNCNVSEVRPSVTAIPLKEDGGESELCSLPDDVFAKIMERLEIIEIFRMTLVCKKWRSLVYNDASMLTKAEHSLTTHLLTFIEWMDPSNTIKGKDYRMHYQSFGWSLIQWCCNVSRNLETLVLPDFDHPYEQVVQSLHHCPNLKHLLFKFKSTGQNNQTNVHLPKLETLIVEESHRESMSKLVVDVFTTSQHFRVFKGRLMRGDLLNIEAQNLNQNPFSNLIALHLESFTTGVLAKLAKLDQLHLRYLCLGDSITLSKTNVFPERLRDEELEAFHALLSRLNQLEVLVSLVDFGQSKSTIKLIMEWKLNLKSAMIWFPISSQENIEGLEFDEDMDLADDLSTLISFQEMLVERDPSSDLSAFEFVVPNKKSKTFLQEANTSFAIHNKYGDLLPNFYDKFDLSNPIVRRKLGIDF